LVTETGVFMKVFLGIDISKATFAAAARLDGKHVGSSQFANTPQGHKAFLSWAQSQSEEIAVCMEATGRHGEALCEFLLARGVFVCVENPKAIRDFLSGLKVQNKTDALDAKGIARYASMADLRPFAGGSEGKRAMRRLVMRQRQLEKQLRQEQNRRSEPGDPPSVRRSLARGVRWIKRELERIDEEMAKVAKEDPNLAQDIELLESTKGIGTKTARRLLGLMPAFSQFDSGKTLAAYAGVCPVQTTSGTSVDLPSHISRQANRHVRAALYLPTQCAIRYNPVIKRFYDRLVERGMPKKQALIAAMRKLLLILYSVLKNRKPFYDPLAT
jgi:transposase